MTTRQSRERERETELGFEQHAQIQLAVEAIRQNQQVAEQKRGHFRARLLDPHARRLFLTPDLRFHVFKQLPRRFAEHEGTAQRVLDAQAQRVLAVAVHRRVALLGHAHDPFQRFLRSNSIEWAKTGINMESGWSAGVRFCSSCRRSW